MNNQTRLLAVILIAYSWECFGQTEPRPDQILATIHSNDMVFLNASNALSSTNLAAAVAAYRAGKVSKEAVMLLAQRAENTEPQDVYGRVVDQNGTPIADVEITGNLAVMGGLGDGATNQAIKTRSNANGLFEFTGIRGWRLSVILKKTGYVATTIKGPEGTNTTLDHREIFTMWKLQGAEPLMGVNGRFKLSYTNSPMNIDLLTGRVVQCDGDLRITVDRPPGTISGRNRLDWSVKIEAVNGGLMDSGGQERITYAAPDNGYQPEITESASKNGNGLEVIRQGLFVQSRNGQIYSKINVTVRINSDPVSPMTIVITGVANTNRSRNWEGTLAQ